MTETQPILTREKLQDHSDSAAQTQGTSNAQKPIPAENVFDTAVYGGISYFAQAAAGIILTNWITHGGGQKHYQRMAEWAGKNFISKITSKRGEAAVKEARSWIVVTTMVNVGNLFILPVKWIEDHKPKFVRWINDRQNAKAEARGYTVTEAERAHQEERLAQIEKEPKQNWWSLGLGRVFGLAAVYAALYGIGNKNNKRAEDAVTKTVIKLTDAVGLKKLAASKPLENYTRISFYDVLYSIISAGGLYVYSHYIEPPKNGKKPQPCDPTPETAKMVEQVDEVNAPKVTKVIKPRDKSIEKPETLFTQKVTAESSPSLQPSL